VSPVLSCPAPRLVSGDAGAGESKKGDCVQDGGWGDALRMKRLCRSEIKSDSALRNYPAMQHENLR